MTNQIQITASEQTSLVEQPSEDMAKATAVFAEAVKWAETSGACAAIRLAATSNPTLPTKAFIAAGVAAGFNKTTLSIQRSKALKGDAGQMAAAPALAKAPAKKLKATPPAKRASKQDWEAALERVSKERGEATETPKAE